MRRFGVVLGLAIGLAAFAARGAEAATLFTWQFCPDAEGTCADNNITSATISVEDTGTGLDAGDPNDYRLVVTITGTDSTKFIDEIGITINGEDTPDDYEAKPSIISAPAAGSPWLVFWGGISGNPDSCETDSTSGNSFCANSGGNTPPTGPNSNGTNVWV